MTSFGVSVSDILVLLFVAVPGYIILTVTSFIGKVNLSQDRFDKLLIVIFSGVFCGSVVTSTYSIVTGSAISREVLNVDRYTLTQLAEIYVLLVIVALILGSIAGLVTDKLVLRESQRTRDHAWDVAFDLSADDGSSEGPVKARIVSRNGVEIVGYVRARGVSDEARDILIEYPTVVIRQDGVIVDTIDIGKRVYISMQAIMQVFFV